MLRLSRLSKNFTAVQPKSLHLGHYLGALGPTLRSNDATISISDLTYLSNQVSQQNLPKNQGKHQQSAANAGDQSLETAKLVMALRQSLSATSTDHFLVYRQSKIPALAELNWILTCHTRVGDLETLKSDLPAGAEVGQLTSPILAAAEAILQTGNLWMTGDDSQSKKTLDFCANLSAHMNGKFSTQVFNTCQTKTHQSIQALQNPQQKMTSDDQNIHNTVLLLDTAKKVTKTLKKSVTDSHPGVEYDLENRPGTSNLIEIYSGLLALKDEKLDPESLKDLSKVDFKHLVTEAVVKELSKIQEHYHQVPDEQVTQLLQTSESEINWQLAAKIRKIKSVVGLF